MHRKMKSWEHLGGGEAQVVYLGETTLLSVFSPFLESGDPALVP